MYAKHKTRRSKNQGSALVFILIAIFLLGALTAMFLRTSTTSEETGDTERARVAASEIIRQGASMKSTVEALLLRGCSETEINFHSVELIDDMGASYDNPNAPADESCNVFSVKGGGLRYYAFPASYYYDSGGAAYRWYVSTYADASYNVEGTPTTTSDLVWYAQDIRKDICVQINRILGIGLENDGSPSFDNQDAWWDYYKGGFRTNVNGIADEVAAKHFKKKAGCYLDPDNNYNFYTVLIAK